MKTAELSGAALDWAVARCEHIPVRIMEIRGVKVVAFESNWNLAAYHDDWGRGGPIIEREHISIYPDPCDDMPEIKWSADSPDVYRCGGPTPLVAAMRCFVAGRFGEEVDIPEELT